MKELEYKYLLEPEVFREKQQQLLDWYPESCKRDVLQINYYYDTADLQLLRDNTTLRVRQIGGQLRMQAKLHTRQVDGCSISEEKESPLETLPSVLSCPEKGTLCYLQGSLVTRRVRYVPIPGIKAEFDENFYLGHYDCELELEFLEERREQVAGLIRRLGLCSPDTVLGKASRFYRAKKDLTGGERE